MTGRGDVALWPSLAATLSSERRSASRDVTGTSTCRSCLRMLSLATVEWVAVYVNGYTASGHHNTAAWSLAHEVEIDRASNKAQAWPRQHAAAGQESDPPRP